MSKHRRKKKKKSREKIENKKKTNYQMNKPSSPCEENEGYTMDWHWGSGAKRHQDSGEGPGLFFNPHPLLCHSFVHPPPGMLREAGVCHEQEPPGTMLGCAPSA